MKAWRALWENYGFGYLLTPQLGNWAHFSYPAKVRVGLWVQGVGYA